MNDTLWASLDRAIEWVKYAESKGLAILGVHAVTLGFFMNIAVDCSKTIRESPVILITLITALVLAFTSIYYSFRCLNPRLALRGGVSPIYFRSIATSFGNSADFLAHYKSRMSADCDLEKEVAGQVYVNCVIASRKFEDVTWALRHLVLSLPFWATVAFLLIFS